MLPLLHGIAYHVSQRGPQTVRYRTVEVKAVQCKLCGVSYVV